MFGDFFSKKSKEESEENIEDQKDQIHELVTGLKSTLIPWLQLQDMEDLENPPKGETNPEEFSVQNTISLSSEGRILLRRVTLAYSEKWGKVYLGRILLEIDLSVYLDKVEEFEGDVKAATRYFETNRLGPAESNEEADE